MKHVSRLTRLSICMTVSLFCHSTSLSADKPEGFGAGSRGGQGGRAIRVTTLADDGPGSLRAALKVVEPRIISFAVAGPIKLQKPIQVRHGRVKTTCAASTRKTLNHSQSYLLA